MDVEIADTMPDGIDIWRQWIDAQGDCSQWYVDTLAADGGRYLGYRAPQRRRRTGKLLLVGHLACLAGQVREEAAVPCLDLSGARHTENTRHIRFPSKRKPLH
ncbi:MAG: hypothetical protein IH991_15120 [Planctomycetes bacterium]|nr:hypothetical protein [Planctomycetota bacterium]